MGNPETLPLKMAQGSVGISFGTRLMVTDRLKLGCPEHGDGHSRGPHPGNHQRTPWVKPHRAHQDHTQGEHRDHISSLQGDK